MTIIYSPKLINTTALVVSECNESPARRNELLRGAARPDGAGLHRIRLVGDDAVVQLLPPGVLSPPADLPRAGGERSPRVLPLSPEPRGSLTSFGTGVLGFAGLRHGRRNGIV